MRREPICGRCAGVCRATTLGSVRTGPPGNPVPGIQVLLVCVGQSMQVLLRCLYLGVPHAVHHGLQVGAAGNSARSACWYWQSSSPPSTGHCRAVDDGPKLSRCDARKVSTYPRWESDHFGRLGIDPQAASERWHLEGADRPRPQDLEEHGRESGGLDGSAGLLTSPGVHELRTVRAPGPTAARRDTIDAGNGAGRARWLDWVSDVVSTKRRSDPTGLRTH
jgi:hypothetical protein